MMNLKKMVKDWLTDCPLFKIVLGLVQMIMKRRVSPWRSQIGEWFLSIYFFLGFWLSYDWQGRIFYQFLFFDIFSSSSPPPQTTFLLCTRSLWSLVCFRIHIKMYCPLILNRGARQTMNFKKLLCENICQQRN